MLRNKKREAADTAPLFSCYNFTTYNILLCSFFLRMASGTLGWSAVSFHFGMACLALAMAYILPRTKLLVGKVSIVAAITLGDLVK